MPVLMVILLAASVTDLRNRTIPNGLTTAGALVGLALATHADRLPEALLAGLLAAAPFLAANLIRPEGMGMGDVKLVAVMGVFMGQDVWLALAAGLAVAGLTGVLISIGQRRAPGHTALPLAPFLALGTGMLLAAGAAPLQ